MSKTILEMTNISKSFGSTKALHGIDFKLEQGEIHALLGENGAGKSTLIKVLGGIHRPDTGTIRINGEPVRLTDVQTAQKSGIGIIHQEIILVPHLSVTENIFLGRELKTKLGTKDMRRMHQKAKEMTERIGLYVDVTAPVGQLGIAQQQLVEIVKAISFNIRILVMDEPTSSLSTEEVEKLFLTMRRLVEQNVSIIYISHRMEELFAITERITVLRDGGYVGTVDTKKTNTDELVSMMVGRSLTSYYTRTYNKTEKEVLRVEGLTRNNLFRDISFSVHAGEILGFAGLVGAGRSEIMHAVFGNIPYDKGSIYMDQKKVRFRSSREAIRSGMAFVPEDRKLQGLTLMNSVGFNITLVSLDSVKRTFLLSQSRKNKLISRYMDALNIKASSKDAPVSGLSGGNQQKVVLARWLATDPKLLILDEPTRGVDIRAKAEIYSIINGLAAEGMAIIMISSELPEIINMCDTVCIVRAGEITGRLDRYEMDQKKIMHHATGGTEYAKTKLH